MTTIRKALFGASLAGLAMLSPAHAATITFNELTHSGIFVPANPIFSGGFIFYANFLHLSAMGVLGTGSGSQQMNPGNASIAHNSVGAISTVAKVGGGLFDLNSVELADVFNNGSGGTVALTFTDGMGTTSQMVTLDNAIGGQTFTFNRTGLLYFTMRGLTTEGQYLQYDNIVVDNNVLGGVPEPASWALMLAGFGLVGGAMRRRSVRVTFA